MKKATNRTKMTGKDKKNPERKGSGFFAVRTRLELATLGVTEEGTREVLGIYNSPVESIERLQKDFRRVTRMRGALLSEESVLLLMGEIVQ